MKDEDALGLGEESVERREEKEDERRVVAEEIPTNDRDEGDVEMGEEPHTLIEDREVKGWITVDVVLLQAEVDEPADVEDDEERDAPGSFVGG